MTTFDDAIESAVKIIAAAVGDIDADIYVVRDTGGSIVAILDDSQLADGEWDALAVKLHAALAPYSDGADRVLLKRSDLIDETEVLNSPSRVSTGLRGIWLIDRTLTNQDWTKPPLRVNARIPTAVAYSVKGGVGRSTAFAMGAWHLARLGHDVLVIDLDLEAPGIGTILLDSLPKLGLADWLMEQINSQGSLELLQSAIGHSTIAGDSNGTIRVIPAYGSGTKNYISKIGRIYAPSLNADGDIVGLAERLDELLDLTLQLSPPPTAILIDSRAGMHDIGSAVVTRLGAEVFLFARNDEQDWWSYQEIFEHLKSSSAVSRGMGNDDDLRWKLQMVAAQVAPREDVRRQWLDDSYSNWTNFYDDESRATEPDFDPVVFDRDAGEAPHFPLFINFELGIRSLPLNRAETRPDWEFVRGVFGDFFLGLERRLFSNVSESGE